MWVYITKGNKEEMESTAHYRRFQWLAGLAEGEVKAMLKLISCPKSANPENDPFGLISNLLWQQH
jgi:hypothetical protein